MFPPITIVVAASMVELWLLPLKSRLTSSSSQYPRMPLRSPSAAFRKAPLTCSTVDVFPVLQTKSITETEGVGTRREKTVNLAFQPGDQLADEFGGAGCGVDHMRAAARARRISLLWTTSRIFLVVGVEWMVVISPC
jgi:hypothetical protein